MSTPVTILAMPDDPAAFWRMCFKFGKRVAVLKRRQDYALDRWSPDTKARFTRIVENLKTAQAIYDAYRAEADRRYEVAKLDLTGREFERFHAPLRYMVRPQFVRADEDGFYRTGRTVNGLPEVRRVSCPK